MECQLTHRRLTSYAACLTLLLFSSAHAATQTPTGGANRPSPTGTATLSGLVVTDDAESRPIRRVRIAIVTSDSQVGRTAITDDNGAFSFTALPAGRYTLTSFKQGYLPLSYGVTRPSRPGTAIVLADGQQMLGLRLRMQRWSVVSGVLLDQNGEHFPGVSVRVMRYGFDSNGQRSLQPGSLVWTDDRGHYRIWGLTAGEYLVMASIGTWEPGVRLDAEAVRVSDADVTRAFAEIGSGASTGSGTPAPGTVAAADARTVGYTRVYYPGTFSPAQATLIKIGVAEDRTGVDFRMSLVSTAKIAGTVVAPEGAKREALTVQVIDTNPVAHYMPFVRRATTTSDGSFSVSGVPPGHYTIAVRGWTRGAGLEALVRAPAVIQPVIQPRLSALTDVTVDGQDVSGISLTLQPGMTLSGRTQFEGLTAPPADLSRVSINLAEVQVPGEVTLDVSPIRADASGAFTMTGIPPGRYRLTASISTAQPGASGWQLKSATVNGRDTLDSPIEFRHNSHGAVITFTDKVSELSGFVQSGSGQPAPESHVILFASDKALWTPQSRRIRSVRPSADGKYTVSNIPPGEYLIAAVTDIEPGEWFDPNVLEQLARTSMKVSIADGEKKTQDLRMR